MGDKAKVTYTCAVCGKTFERWRSYGGGAVSVYCCSRKCMGISQRKTLERTCEHCGKSFTCRPSEERRFCSRACYNAMYTNRVTKTCPTCGKAFTVKAGMAHRYTNCSRACQSADAEYAPCPRCGKVFNTDRGRRKYCSELCRRPPVINTCRECGKQFRIVPAMSYQKFCSPTCYRRHQGETEPEGNVRRCLTALGLEFVQESPIDRYPVDFYVPSLNVAFEVDGVYWHKRPDADRRKTLRLIANGFLVVRVPDTPFYGPVTDNMIAEVKRALVAANDCVASANLGGDYPIQLSLPVNQDGVIGSSVKPKPALGNEPDHARVVTQTHDIGDATPA